MLVLFPKEQPLSPPQEHPPLALAAGGRRRSRSCSCTWSWQSWSFDSLSSSSCSASCSQLPRYIFDVLPFTRRKVRTSCLKIGRRRCAAGTPSDCRCTQPVAIGSSSDFCDDPAPGSSNYHMHLERPTRLVVQPPQPTRGWRPRRFQAAVMSHSRVTHR
jgi:hypothetical protein